MQFLVLTKAATTNLPPQVTLQLVRQTFEMAIEKREPRIKQAFSFAGERAGAFVVEVGSAEELSDVISDLPFSGIVDVTIHALTTLEQSLKTIKKAEQRVAQMTPATMGR
jgi:muconolactone delta-isomerase